MFSLSKIVVFSSLVLCVAGVPIRHFKRIAQVIADSTQDWEQACVRHMPGTLTHRLMVPL